jgi:hypothetical protein
MLFEYTIYYLIDQKCATSEKQNEIFMQETLNPSKLNLAFLFSIPVVKSVFTSVITHSFMPLHGRMER